MCYPRMRSSLTCLSSADHPWRRRLESPLLWSFVTTDCTKLCHLSMLMWFNSARRLVEYLGANEEVRNLIEWLDLIYWSSTGSKYTPSIIADVFWKPFDLRFSALLSRLQSHREVFQNEVQLEESKWTELQHDKRAKQSDLNGRALEQIKMQLEELQRTNTDMDSMLSNRLETIERVFHDMSSNARQNKMDELQERRTLGAYMRHITAKL